MSDIFREVDEEYRQEQFLRFWHANARYIILILVIAIAVASGISWWKARQKTIAEDQTFALSQALDEAHGKAAAEARDIMINAANRLTGGRKVAAELAAARFAGTANDKEGALKLYGEVASDGHASAADKDIAKISSLILRIDSGDPGQLARELDPLAGEDSAWRFTARELQGVLALRQGDLAKAKQIFTNLAASQAADTPPGIRETAMDLQQIVPLPSAK
jgi:hypothetical protein